MNRAPFLAALWITGLAVGAQAQYVSVTPDRHTYAVGWTITLNVVGDAQSAESMVGIWGRLVYPAALTNPSGIAPTQNTHTFVGGGTATVGPLTQGEGYGPSGAGYSDAFNQLFPAFPVTPAQNTTSEIKLVAAAEGTLDFYWESPSDGLGNGLLYFGAGYSGPIASVTIVPEPGAAAPLALGFLALLASPRRREL